MEHASVSAAHSLLHYPLKFDFALSNRELMGKDILNHEPEGFHGLLTPSPKLGCRGKYPAAELSELFFRNGGTRFLATADDHTVCTRDDERLSFHKTSSSFCLSEQRRIAGEPSAMPSSQHLPHRRGHSMPAGLNEVKYCHSDSCADFILMSGSHADHSIHHSAFLDQAIIRKQSSMGPAIASQHDPLPDALQVTANGESSQTRNNDALLSPDAVVRSSQTSIIHDQVHTEVSGHDSATAPTEASSPHIVLDMTVPSAESTRTASSLERREFGPVLHPPSPESGRGSFINTGREEETLFYRPKLTEASIGITAQAVLALLTIRSSGSTSNLSDSAKIILRYAVACNIVGFLCCNIGILVGGHKPGVAARITTGVGHIATIYGFVAVVSMQLDDNLKLWINVATWIALIPVLLAFVFRRI